MRYCVVIQDGFVSQLVPCPASEFDRFSSVNPGLIEIKKEKFDEMYAMRGGRFKREGGEFIFIKDSDNRDIVAAQAIAQRTTLLASSDWTQLPDVPAQTKEAWIEYRQALRDITSQSGFPFVIDWPVQPSATGGNT